jgi:tetraprenyl-beta-curcumene synthase
VSTLRPRQLWAVVAAANRQLLWGLKAVSHEVRIWQRRAAEIPDERIRGHALHALATKRPHLDGAALFWILPRRRNLRLLRLLVVYEIALEFLDEMTEQVFDAGLAHRCQLHLALAEALDLQAPISDYYLFAPEREDGGYLQALVRACRDHCAGLPSYHRVRTLLLREATRAQVLALNHDPDPDRRDASLREWVSRELPGQHEAAWFELSAAATASLTVHALLALAAEPACDTSEIARVHAVYFPWCSLATTMLDSYVDQLEDSTTARHSYLGHYVSHEAAIRRLSEVVDRSVRDASNLQNGCRHNVIVACMVAMYLSKDSARTPQLSASTHTLLRAGGSLPRLLLPILRAWRVAYGLRSA